MLKKKKYQNLISLYTNELVIDIHFLAFFAVLIFLINTNLTIFKKKYNYDFRDRIQNKTSRIWIRCRH